jgi:deaminated glutathione amidase
MATLWVATCQFAVGSSVERNAEEMLRLIRQAAAGAAHVVHFPEAALTGYAGTDLDDLSALDWDAVTTAFRALCAAAREHGVWLVFGGTHRLSGANRPHNSLYVVSAEGKIVDRYDKRFCTGADLNHYSPGNHFVEFQVRGVRCGLLICYDVRFPELYRAYSRSGVRCVFHSFYNAHARHSSIHTVIMRPTLQARAATNAMWVSAPNACGYYQSWPSVFVNPDGAIAGSLTQHRPGFMLNVVDTEAEFYDASGPFRRGAMDGVLNSGTVVNDPRSADRSSR